MQRKATNKRFNDYDAYLRHQVRKVRADRQQARGGLSWEYGTQATVKPDLVRWVAEVQPPVETAAVLVLGARWGADVRFLREAGYKHAIDAFDLYDPPLSPLVRVGDAHDLDACGAAENAYQLVWAYHVFEHFWDPSLVLHDLHRFVARGGHMFVAMPDFGVPDKYDAQDVFETRDEWEQLLSDTGWVVTKYDSYPIKGKRRPAHFYILEQHGS